MKRTLLLLSLALLSVGNIVAQNLVSGIYIGGHIRRERPGTIAKLRNSGFTTALLFNVHVDTDGTLMTDGETICKDGQYVFQKTQPYYQQDIRDLKTAPTSIRRVEIVIGGWGNDSYQHIRDLIKAKGTGSSTMLYKNFKALIEAVPEIEAVNNDDEHCYDLETAAKFHIMMYDLGYKTTLAPYTNRTYWQNLCTKIRASRPKAVDCIMVQCYEGGAGNINNLAQWTFTGVSNRQAGLQNYDNGSDVAKNLEQFQKWADAGLASGGFVWVYNDETWNLNAWASGMNRIFKAMTVEEEDAMLEVFSGTNYKGYSVKLPVGVHTQADLALYGVTANDIESARVLKDGVTAKLYTSSDNTGKIARSVTAKAPDLLVNKNKINSITVEYVDPSGILLPTTEQFLVSVVGGNIHISGAENGEDVSAYTIGGVLIGQTTVQAGQATLRTHVPQGTVVVLKVGKMSRKVRM